MKIAYFDCASGISGDMVLGALIDAGLDLNVLIKELKKLNVSGYELKAERVKRNSISGTKITVEISEDGVERHLSHIVKIIDDSTLDREIKDLSKKIFFYLAEVEAKIHNTGIEKVHFHEVGALDSIIDIIGTVIGINKLGIDKIFASKVHLGTGFVNTRHGKLQVPVPATAELLKGVPVYSTGVESELVTPTGAVLLKTLSQGFGDIPSMKIDSIGYGAGSKILKIPNLLRIFIGTMQHKDYHTDHAVLLETNIDDMNPEFFDYLSERLMEEGALDVYKTPIFMKKNRPATLLSLLINAKDIDKALSIIFSESTTIGVRIQRLDRAILEREILQVETKFGKINIKVSKFSGKVSNISPEYEDCKKIASENNIPLKEIYDEAKAIARSFLYPAD
ncbi:nickel pincer cofactor biosynthesis protein LarC [candidate division KSB1 bacterium]